MYGMFKPLDFMARLAALVPGPRSHLIRFHGLFAPNVRHRRLAVPAPLEGAVYPTPTNPVTRRV
jgi:hypothetical protein